MFQVQVINNVVLWEKRLEMDYEKRNIQPDKSYWDDLDRPHPVRELREGILCAIERRQISRESNCAPCCYSGKYQETRLK